jgi:hypothetical protein
MRVASAMALAIMVACNKEGNGNSGKSNGDKGGRQAMGIEGGGNGDGNNMGDGNIDETGGQGKGQWQGQQGK